MTGHRSFPYIATILTALGMIILCSLGTWQLKRLSWKTEILKTIESAQTQSPKALSFDDLNTAQDPATYYKYGKVEGRITHDPVKLQQVKIMRDKPGHHIFAPVVMDSEKHVIVHLGWIDQEDSMPELSGTKISLEGYARILRKGPFTPRNAPYENIWLWPDTQKIGKSFGLEPVAKALFFSTNAVHESVKPHDTSWRPNNRHAQYAIFWFTMGIALLGIYILRFWVFTTNLHE